MLNTKSLLFASSALLAGLAFVACGDENTYVTESGNDLMAVLESGADISTRTCDSTNVGALLFVMDSSAAFLCDGKGWISQRGADGKDGKDGRNAFDGKKGADGADGMRGEKGDRGDAGADGTGCTAEEVMNSERSGYKISCGGETVGILWNGIDGIPGENGLQGNTGEGCSERKVWMGKRSGYEISCGHKVVDTLWNGIDGAQGEEGAKGDNGVGCSLKDDHSGVVLVSCGTENAYTLVYKAMCGSNPYDPLYKFCLDGKLFDLCKNKAYDPTKYFCDTDDGVIEMPKCKGAYFNPLTHFCKGSAVIDNPMCDDKTYNPYTHYCSGNTLTELTCAGTPYNIDSLYCKNGKTLEEYEIMTDSRDQKTYKTVVIGSQTWMAENLNYAYTKTPYKVDNFISDSISWCLDNDINNCYRYGRLYTWAAAIDSLALRKNNMECGLGKVCKLKGKTVQGVCPTGWHLPSSDEWLELIAFVENGEDSTAGKKLKSTSEWKSDNGDGAFGFSVLPSRYRKYTGLFYERLGENAYFWTSSEYAVFENATEDQAGYAMNFGVRNTLDRLSERIEKKYYAFSVRCIKN